MSQRLFYQTNPPDGGAVVDANTVWIDASVTPPIRRQCVDPTASPVLWEIRGGLNGSANIRMPADTSTLLVGDPIAPAAGFYVTVESGALLILEPGWQSSEGDASVASMRALGTGPLNACAGNDSRLSDARPPTAHTHAESEVTGLVSDLAGKCSTSDSRLSDARTPLSHTHPESDITNLTTDLAAKEATANKNAASGYAGLDGSSKLTGSQQVYGSGANTACQGNDARLSDARTPTAHASSHNAGGSDALAIDAAAGTGSLRTIGTTALKACAGNDSRLSDSRTPTAHASTHDSGGSDAMAVDAAAGTGSLRSLGAGSTNACAGNDSRLSDSRTPTAHAASHKSGGGDAIKLDELAAPTDVTTLNVSTSAHGLAPKGTAVGAFLRDDATWASLGIVPIGQAPGADASFVAATIVVLGTPFAPDAGVMISLDATTVLVLPPQHDCARLGAVCREPSDFISLGNDTIYLEGTDAFVIDSPVLISLSAGTLLALVADDWQFTGKMSNRQGNLTLNADESAVIPSLLIVDTSGLCSINDANGTAVLMVL